MGRVIFPILGDEEFIRGKVPMTKASVRHLVITKLMLEDECIFFDVGSGTGSIAVEAARLSEDIQVYAIERNPEAVGLIKDNMSKFAVSNIEIVPGEAPAAFDKLPPPDSAFIGGSSGNMEEILLKLKAMNPDMRVVITGVSLETISEINRITKILDVKNLDMEQVAISRVRQMGDYNMMMAENPVLIAAFDF